MSTLFRSKLKAWRRASRPLAQANIAAPLLLGQALAFRVTDRFSWTTLLLVAAFGIFDQLFIVYANDYADRDDDDDARTPFSGGSGVLQDGLLSPLELKRGAYVAALGTLSTSTVLSVECYPIALLGFAAVLLLIAYSYPPLRLSHRGGGEWLQGLGVGAVLPLIGFGAQAGGFHGFPWLVLVGTVGLAAMGNVATAMPDIDTDRRANKRTWPVRFGKYGARIAALALSFLSIGIVAWIAGMYGHSIIALSAVALIPWLRPAFGRRRILLLVFSHGLAMQLLYLGWSWLLVRQS